MRDPDPDKASESQPEPSAQRRLVAVACGVATGVLLSMAYHPLDWGWLAWIAPVPWLVALAHPRPAWSVTSTWVMGFVFCMLGLWWISEVTLLGMFITVGLLSLNFIVLGIVVRTYLGRLGGPLFGVVPAAWVALEWVRSWLFGGLAWLYVGHTQWSNVTMIQIADIGGAWLVSLLVLVIAAILADLVAGRLWSAPLRRRWMIPGVAMLVVLPTVTYFYGRYRLTTGDLLPGPRLAIVQGNIPQEVKNSSQTQLTIRDPHIALTHEAARAEPRPDQILWAETMLPGSPTTEAEYYDLMCQLARHHEIPLLVGTNIHAPDGPANEKLWLTYNTVMSVRADGTSDTHYRKIRLVQVGEYIPYRDIMPWIPNVVRNMVGYVPDIARGNEATIFKLDRYEYGALICNESTFPELASALRRGGAQYLINPTNDGWFKESAELEQVLAICVFRAVENRVGVVRAANTGISAFIDPDGRIHPNFIEVDGKRKSVRGRLHDRVYVDKRKTLYTETIGEAVPHACLIWTALLMVAVLVRRRK